MLLPSPTFRVINHPYKEDSALNLIHFSLQKCQMSTYGGIHRN